MRFNTITNALTRAASRVIFETKKHAPELLLIAGFGFGVACVVKACQATPKATAVLEIAKADIDEIHNAIEASSTDNNVNYPAEVAKKDMTKVYLGTGVELIKLYSPAIGFGVLSGTCILSGHNILKKRNIALAAAYTAVDSAFKEYSGRVKEFLGEEVERDLRQGIVAKTISKQIVDDNGEVHTVEETVRAVDNDRDHHSDYARYFDERCRGVWKHSHDLNMMTLRCEQQYANDKLVADGYLFLNAVYERLGIEPTIAGQQVGWIYDPDRPNGDNYINFNIREVYRKKHDSLVDEYEPVIMLDFNVDGPIFNALETRNMFANR